MRVSLNISKWKVGYFNGFPPPDKERWRGVTVGVSLRRDEWASLLVVQCRVAIPETTYRQITKADSAGCIYLFAYTYVRNNQRKELRAEETWKGLERGYLAGAVRRKGEKDGILLELRTFFKMEVKYIYIVMWERAEVICQSPSVAARPRVSSGPTWKGSKTFRNSLIPLSSHILTTLVILSCPFSSLHLFYTFFTPSLFTNLTS